MVPNVETLKCISIKIREKIWKPTITGVCEVAQSCPTLSNPMDCSLPGSSVHGIIQARVPEWGATAFSNGSQAWTKILGL